MTPSSGGTGGCPGAHPGQNLTRVALSATVHGPDEDVLPLGGDLAGDLGPQHVPDGGGPEIFDQDRGDDARMLSVVGRGGDRRAGDGVEHGPVDGPVRIGVIAGRGQGGHGAAHTTTVYIDPEEGGEGVVLRTCICHAVTPWVPPAPGAGPAWARPWPANACGSPCSGG